MLYLFDDSKKLARAIAQFRNKNPAGLVHQFDAEDWLEKRASFEELLASHQSLFGEKNLIILREVAALTDEAKEQIKKSETIVLWFQPAVNKPAEFNVFSIGALLARRDGAVLWLAYQRALATGLPAEAVFWPLAWQVKQMLLGVRPLGRFTRAALAQFSARLVALWHDTKREEGRDFGLSFERLLLGV